MFNLTPLNYILLAICFSLICAFSYVSLQRDKAKAELNAATIQLNQIKADSAVHESKMKQAEQQVKVLQKRTVKENLTIANAKIGSSCDDAMNYLRQFGGSYGK